MTMATTNPLAITITQSTMTTPSTPRPDGYGHPSRRRSAAMATVVLLSLALLAAVAVARTQDNMSLSFNSDHDEEYDIIDHDQTVTTTYEMLAHRAHRMLKSKYTHKKLLPLDTSDKLGFFFATLGLMIAAGGGIGGGGVLVPIYILVMGFNPKHAIPLSNITVFGGAVANTILNVRKRHPLADRPLVDWDLILVMEPLTIAGALIGAFMNKLLPEAILAVSLVALLSVTAYTTLKKAIRMYKAETRAMLAEKGVARVREDGTKESELTRLARELEEEEEDDEEDRQVAALLDDVGNADQDEGENENHENDNDTHENGNGNDDVENGQHQHQHQIPKQSSSTASSASDDDSTFSSATDLKNKEDLTKILEEERHMPMGNVQVLCLTFAVIIIINLLKGGGAFKSPLGIKCGQPSFWVANGAMLGWILLVSIFARSYLVRRCEIKERCGYPYVEGDIKWDGRATVVYPVVCTAAGFFAGMFGVGGGIVKGPLMLAMGVHPKVSSASSACMILFTSFTATTSFVVFGLLDMEYAAICLTLGFVATLVGQIGLFYLMERFQRNSYIAFSIGGIVLLSAFLMTIQSLFSMADAGGPKPPSGLCTGKH